jgi:hypothetical protein
VGAYTDSTHEPFRRPQLQIREVTIAQQLVRTAHSFVRRLTILPNLYPYGVERGGKRQNIDNSSMAPYDLGLPFC